LSTGTLEPVRVLFGVPVSGRHPVYDLTVDGCHEFFANGILVHNSMDQMRYVCRYVDAHLMPGWDDAYTPYSGRSPTDDESGRWA
jgi:hypothetical protein